MAACTLKIELDDAYRPRSGGEELSGSVVVQCHKNIQCNGLEVSTGWKTHGRGNVDSGVCETVTVYSGAWQAGQTYRYSFKLHAGTWPPTYHGNFLNVRHAVSAQAKIPWSFDPKTEFEFPLVVNESPVDLQPTRPELSGIGKYIGWIIAGILLLVFGFLLIWLVPILLIIGGLVWFFKSYLPKQMTGNVEFTVEPVRAKPGTVIAGHLKFTPRRNATINNIRYRVRCIEQCVSGSGSNRKTHTHELLQVSEELAGGQVLSAGMPQEFRFEYQLPVQAAPSLDLNDNDLKWSVEARIDIPRWPDWSKEIPVIVEPAGEVVSATPDGFVAAEPLSPEDQWLREVLEQLQQSSQDPERLALVLQAIKEHRFKMAVILEEESQPPPANSPGPGQWFDGYLVDPELAVQLFVPADRPVPELEVKWLVLVQIVDFDPKRESLVLHA